MAGPQSPHSQGQISTDRLSYILQQDRETKEKLVEIYDDVNVLLSQDPDPTLDSEISVQHRNYATKLVNYPKDFMGDERPIIVTGETGAGKSSVLNLLIGFDVFPTSMLACTGAICRLRTSKMKKADIIDFNEKIVRTFRMEGNDKNKFAIDLKGYIKPKTENRDTHQIKFVDIYWPIPFLTENVIVVDTPGIGESEEMTERLVSYLPNAVVLIYVIDPSHGGGIASDRIVPLFDAILGQENNGMKQAFDRSCAMFLCNKWDLVVESGDVDEVWEFIRNQLEFYWPGIKDKQIYRFSAKETKRQIRENEKLPEDFIKFKKGMEELIKVSLNAKSRQNISWITTFLKTIYTSLSSHLSHIKLSQEERSKQVQNARFQLEKIKKCRKKAYKCLKINNGEEILKELKQAVKTEIKIIEKARNTLEQLLEIPEKKDDKDQEVLDDKSVDDSFELTNTEKVVIAVTAPLWFPLGLVGGLVGIPVALAVVGIKDKVAVAKYKRNKEQYMEKWATSYLEAIDESAMETWVQTHIFGTFYEKLEKVFNEELSQAISGFTKLVDNFEVCREATVRERYKSKLKQYHHIQKKLRTVERKCPSDRQMQSEIQFSTSN